MINHYELILALVDMRYYYVYIMYITINNHHMYKSNMFDHYRSLLISTNPFEPISISGERSFFHHVFNVSLAFVANRLLLERQVEALR